MSTVANIATVARREFTVRVSTRTFVIGTVLLVLGVVAIALLPVITRYIDRTEATKIAVAVAVDDLERDPVETLSSLLNAPSETPQPDPAAKPDFVVSAVDDVASGRQQVLDGAYAALFAIDRSPDGELAFTLYTDEATPQATSLAWQAANAMAVADRLDRLGVAAAEQEAVFAPAAFEVAWPDPERTDPVGDTMAMFGQDMLAFGMTVLIFIIIVMYGSWIAMSVVEEKSSRVMEVVLNAATPFQLMAGKVLGVSAVAFTQYLAIVVSGGIALLLQQTIATTVLGEGGGAGLPEGLTLGMLLVFAIYGVLGFLLYACLYAAAGSLVSRQEDVNTAIMPLTFVTMAGYFVAIYSSIGLLDMREGWVTVVSHIPFVSAFTMLGRISTGVAAPWEFLLSIALLVVTIAGSLWVASRIYAAGVLMYGQRPSIRAVLRLVRTGM